MLKQLLMGLELVMLSRLPPVLHLVQLLLLLVDHSAVKAFHRGGLNGAAPLLETSLAIIAEDVERLQWLTSLESLL